MMSAKARVALVSLGLALILGFAGAHASDVPSSGPRVIETFPETESTGVPLDARIMAVFSRPMQAQDVNEFTVTLNDGIADIACAVRYNEELRKLVMTPLDELAPKRQYFVTISRTIRDGGGETLSKDHTFGFSTAERVVRTPPIVSQVAPLPGAEGVPPTSRIEVHFDRAMLESSLHEESITVASGTRKIVGAIRYFAGDRKVFFQAHPRLPENAVITVTLGRDVKDRNGVPLGTIRKWSFRTSRTRAEASIADLRSSPRVSPSGKEARPAAPPAEAGRSVSASEPASEPLEGLLERRKAALRKSARITESLPEPESAASAETAGAENEPESAGSGIKESRDPASTARTAGPEVVEQKPAPDSQGLSLTPEIAVRFDRPMNPTSFNIFSFSLREGEEYIFGKVDYDAGARRAAFAPSGDLKPGTAYTATLSEKITDAEGRALGKPLSWTFSTVAVWPSRRLSQTPPRDPAGVDTLGPEVIRVLPAEGASEIPANAQLAATFDEALNPATVNGYTFRLNGGGADVVASVHYDPSQRKALLTPAQPLEPGRAYTAILTRGVSDVSGNMMSRDRRWKFLVGRSWGARGPRPVAFAPRDGEESVSTAQSLSAVFSENLDPSSVNEYTVLVNDGAKNVPGVVRYEAAAKTVRFTPAGGMKPGRRYTMTFTKGVAAQSGAALDAPVTSAFVTAGTDGGFAPPTNVSSVASSDASIRRIELLKRLGSDAVTPMAETGNRRVMETIEELDGKVEPDARRARTTEWVGGDESRRRLAASDKGPYGLVTPARISEPETDITSSGEAAGQEIRAAASISDKGVLGRNLRTHPSGAHTWGSRPGSVQSRDTSDLGGVRDTAMETDMKDRIARFLGPDAGRRARLARTVLDETDKEDVALRTGAAVPPAPENEPALRHDITPETLSTFSRIEPPAPTPVNAVGPVGSAPVRSLPPDLEGVPTLESVSGAAVPPAVAPADAVAAARPLPLAPADAAPGGLPESPLRREVERFDAEPRAAAPPVSQTPTEIAKVPPAQAPPANLPPENTINGIPVSLLDGDLSLAGKPKDEVVPDTRASGTEFSRPTDLDFHDPTRLLVTAIYPNRSMTAVRRDAIITAVFNRDLLAASVSPKSFFVTENEKPVAGKILYNQRMKKLIFRPSTPFQAGGRVEVALAPGIRSEAGQPLLPFKWGFEVE